MSRLPRAERVIPAVIALGAILLIASEFLVVFEFTSTGGEPEQQSIGGDRHYYSLLLLALFALAATGFAIASGSRPAAVAVAVAGGAALLIFLLFDLPDAGQVGALEDFVTARAEPQIGFWLEAIGAIALAVGGGALATLTPEQLQGIRDERGGEVEGGAAAASGSAAELPNGAPSNEAERRQAADAIRGRSEPSERPPVGP